MGDDAMKCITFSNTLLLDDAMKCITFSNTLLLEDKEEENSLNPSSRSIRFVYFSERMKMRECFKI